MPIGTLNGQIVIAKSRQVLARNGKAGFIFLVAGQQKLLCLFFGHAVFVTAKPLVVMVAEHQCKRYAAAVQRLCDSIHRRPRFGFVHAFPPACGVVAEQNHQIGLGAVERRLHKRGGFFLWGVGILHIRQNQDFKLPVVKLQFFFLRFGKAAQRQCANQQHRRK